MLIQILTTCTCANCGKPCDRYSPSLKASLCGEECKKELSDRLYQELVTAEGTLPEGQLQPRPRAAIAKLGNRSFSIS